MIDRYTKIVLTVIAVALGAIAFQGAVGRAQAQIEGCGGDPANACYVQGGVDVTGDVTVDNLPPP